MTLRLIMLHMSWNHLFSAGSLAGLGWNQNTGKGFWPQKRSITDSNSKCQVLLLGTMGNHLNWGVGGSIGLVWCNCRCLEVILFSLLLSPECTVIYLERLPPDSCFLHCETHLFSEEMREAGNGVQKISFLLKRLNKDLSHWDVFIHVLY